MANHGIVTLSSDRTNTKPMIFRKTAICAWSHHPHSAVVIFYCYKRWHLVSPTHSTLARLTARRMKSRRSRIFISRIIILCPAFLAYSSNVYRLIFFVVITAFAYVILSLRILGRHSIFCRTVSSLDIHVHAHFIIFYYGAAVGRWTCDWQVAGSNPSRSAFTWHRST